MFYKMSLLLIEYNSQELHFHPFQEHIYSPSQVQRPIKSIRVGEGGYILTVKRVGPVTK